MLFCSKVCLEKPGVWYSTFLILSKSRTAHKVEGPFIFCMQKCISDSVRMKIILILFIGWSCAGIPYEYKAVDLSRGEQFSDGETVDLSPFDGTLEMETLSWGSQHPPEFLESFTRQWSLGSITPRHAFQITKHFRFGMNQHFDPFYNCCMLWIVGEDLTRCSNDHQICCRVHKAEPIADGPIVGH